MAPSFLTVPDPRCLRKGQPGRTAAWQTRPGAGFRDSDVSPEKPRATGSPTPLGGRPPACPGPHQKKRCLSCFIPALTRGCWAGLLLENLLESPLTITNYVCTRMSGGRGTRQDMQLYIWHDHTAYNKNYSCKNWKEALKMRIVIVLGWWSMGSFSFPTTCLFSKLFTKSAH